MFNKRAKSDSHAMFATFADNLKLNSIFQSNREKCVPLGCRRQSFKLKLVIILFWGDSTWNSITFAQSYPISLFSRSEWQFNTHTQRVSCLCSHIIKSALSLCTHSLHFPVVAIHLHSIRAQHKGNFHRTQNKVRANIGIYIVGLMSYADFALAQLIYSCSYICKAAI